MIHLLLGEDWILLPYYIELKSGAVDNSVKAQVVSVKLP